MYSKATMALAVCVCSTILPARGMAAEADASGPTFEQLQQQIDQLQQQLKQMKSAQDQPPNPPTLQSAPESTEAAAGIQDSPTLNINGSVVAEYQVRDDHHARNQRTGGDLLFDYFQLGVNGDAGNGITYSADYQWSETNFADGQFLHDAWAAYTFGREGSSQVKAGFFKVPFANLPYGFQSFWCPARYYLGFNDNQAAGVSYQYESGGLRVDVAVFKNDDLQQTSTYGANPYDGYDQINGGAVRLAYTFNKGGKNSLEVSGSVRGGQLEVDNVRGGDSNGTRWAAALAATANLGLWTLNTQITDYRYNVPDDSSLPRNAITFEDYGFGYQVPASGQMYSFSFARSIPVSLGPISAFSVYDDIDYLDVGGDGSYADTYAPTGVTDDDTIFNVAGVSMTAGPIMMWADIISSKNGALGFNGPNDNNWHHRFNLAAAFYFDGDLIQ